MKPCHNRPCAQLAGKAQRQRCGRNVVANPHPSPNRSPQTRPQPYDLPSRLWITGANQRESSATRGSLRVKLLAECRTPHKPRQSTDIYRQQPSIRFLR